MNFTQDGYCMNCSTPHAPYSCGYPPVQCGHCHGWGHQLWACSVFRQQQQQQQQQQQWHQRQQHNGAVGTAILNRIVDRIIERHFPSPTLAPSPYASFQQEGWFQGFKSGIGGIIGCSSAAAALRSSSTAPILSTKAVSGSVGGAGAAERLSDVRKRGTAKSARAFRGRRGRDVWKRMELEVVERVIVGAESDDEEDDEEAMRPASEA